MRLPDGFGVAQAFGELGQPLSFDRWSPAAGAFGRRRRKEVGVETQSGDDADAASDCGKEFDGGESAVADQDDAAAGKPAVDLQDGLAGTIDQRLRGARLVAIEALRRSQHGEEGQRHDAARPGHLDQQLGTEPTQTAGFDEVSLGGANGIAVDAAGPDLGSPPSLDRIVETDHHRRIRLHEGGDEQAQ